MPRFDRRTSSIEQLSDAMAGFSRFEAQRVRTVLPGTHQLRIGEHLVVRTAKFEDSGIIQLPKYQRDKIGIESRITVVGDGWVTVKLPPGMTYTTKQAMLSSGALDERYVNHRSPSTFVMVDSKYYLCDAASYYTEMTDEVTSLTLTTDYQDVFSDFHLFKYPGERAYLVARLRVLSDDVSDKTAWFDIYDVDSNASLDVSYSRQHDNWGGETIALMYRINETDVPFGTDTNINVRAKEVSGDLTLAQCHMMIMRNGPNVGSGGVP